MTTFLWKYAAGALVVTAIVVGLFYAGVRYANNMRELDDLRDRTETRERIDDAISADPDCSWIDRLQSSCE